MIIKGAEPFFLPGSHKGVLLVHGFTGSPSEMILLGNDLYKRGYTVLGVRLAGHGTSVEEMAKTTWQQWYHSVCDGYHLLRGFCDEISVVGLSMGGLLSIRLGIDFPVKKVVSMSAPVFIANERNLRFLPPLERSAGRYHRKNRRHLPELAKRYNVSYNKIPLVCVHQLMDIIAKTKAILPQLEKPILIVQSENDHTVFIMIIKGAEPFFLPGSHKGVLLVHGFTGSPSEMILLGNDLYKRGYTVLGVRLAGHGTSVEEMAKTTWQQWYHSVCDGYHLLRGFCDEISVVGLSMGGLLSIRLGIDFPVKKVVSMSAPVFIANERNLRFLPPLERSAGRYHRKNRRHLPELAKRYNVSYNKIPLVCVHQLMDIIAKTKAILPQLEKPILIVQSENDHTVKAESGQYIFDHVQSKEKKLFKIELSGHLVTLDVEHDKVFKEINDFLKFGAM